MDKTRAFKTLLVGHMVLVTLAATNFTLVSRLWGKVAWICNYYTYTHENGWGYAYVSDYSLPQVLCYIAAYALGFSAFVMDWGRSQFSASAVAAFLCLVGGISFCMEGTHWLWGHNFSWIASFPVVMVALWVIVWLHQAQNGVNHPKKSVNATSS